MPTKTLITLFIFIAAISATFASPLEIPVIATSTPAFSPDQIDIYSFEPGAKPESASYSAEAISAYNSGNYERSAKYYLAYLQGKPEDSTAWYNLSCCFGLLGKPELAGKYLMRAYKAGYTDLEHIKADRDFSAVRAHAYFSATMDSLSAFSAKKQNLKGEMRYLPARALMPYYLHLPKNYDATKEYPLVIGLHGYGDVAAKFSSLWRYLEQAELIFVVPEAQYPFQEGNIGFSWQPESEYFSEDSRLAYELMTGYLQDLQDSLAGEYKISQTWIAGFSQGAYMGYMIALNTPNRYTGLVACGGGLVIEALTNVDYKAAQSLCVIISHGNNDKVVPFTEGQKAYQFLREKGFSKLYMDEFSGGHTVSPTAITKMLSLIAGKD